MLPWNGSCSRFLKLITATRSLPPGSWKKQLIRLVYIALKKQQPRTKAGLSNMLHATTTSLKRVNSKVVFSRTCYWPLSNGGSSCKKTKV